MWLAGFLNDLQNVGQRGGKRTAWEEGGRRRMDNFKGGILVDPESRGNQEAVAASPIKSILCYG